jgi:hypothetical protein
MNLRERLFYFVEHPEELHEQSCNAGRAEENQIREELRLQTPRCIEWKHLASLARYELGKAERNLDRVKSDLRESIRARLKQDGEKETIDKVDDRLKLTPIYIETKRRVDDLKLISDMLEDTAYAISERKGCLQSFNARQGKEIDQYTS